MYGNAMIPPVAPMPDGTGGTIYNGPHAADPSWNSLIKMVSNSTENGPQTVSFLWLKCILGCIFSLSTEKTKLGWSYSLVLRMLTMLFSMHSFYDLCTWIKPWHLLLNCQTRKCGSAVGSNVHIFHFISEILSFYFTVQLTTVKKKKHFKPTQHNSSYHKHAYCPIRMSFFPQLCWKTNLIWPLPGAATPSQSPSLLGPVQEGQMRVSDRLWKGCFSTWQWPNTPEPKTELYNPGKGSLKRRERLLGLCHL